MVGMQIIQSAHHGGAEEKGGNTGHGELVDEGDSQPRGQHIAGNAVDKQGPFPGAAPGSLIRQAANQISMLITLTVKLTPLIKFRQSSSLPP